MKPKPLKGKQTTTKNIIFPHDIFYWEDVAAAVEWLKKDLKKEVGKDIHFDFIFDKIDEAFADVVEEAGRDGKEKEKGAG